MTESAVVVAFAVPLRVTVAPAPVLVRVPETTAVTASAKLFEAIPFWAAEMLVEPLATPVARPVELILAFVGAELAQVAVLVRFWMLPSLKVPVAVNCSVSPILMDVFGAVTLMDCSVGAVTVSAKVLEAIPFWVAVMLLEPIPDPVARPEALMLTMV